MLMSGLENTLDLPRRAAPLDRRKWTAPTLWTSPHRPPSVPGRPAGAHGGTGLRRETGGADRLATPSTPGSDPFLVFDTGYLTGDLPDLWTERWQRRTGVVKLTYLKAF